MKIIAKKMSASELKQGDLFSIKDQYYWDIVTDRLSPGFNDLAVAHQIFLRSVNECPKEQKKTVVYRITIKQ